MGHEMIELEKTGHMPPAFISNKLLVNVLCFLKYDMKQNAD